MDLLGLWERGDVEDSFALAFGFGDSSTTNISSEPEPERPSIGGMVAICLALSVLVLEFAVQYVRCVKVSIWTKHKMAT